MAPERGKHFFKKTASRVFFGHVLLRPVYDYISICTYRIVTSMIPCTVIVSGFVHCNGWWHVTAPSTPLYMTPLPYPFIDPYDVHNTTQKEKKKPKRKYKKQPSRSILFCSDFENLCLFLAIQLVRGTTTCTCHLFRRPPQQKQLVLKDKQERVLEPRVDECTWNECFAWEKGMTSFPHAWHGTSNDWTADGDGRILHWKVRSTLLSLWKLTLWKTGHVC